MKRTFTIFALLVAALWCGRAQAQSGETHLDIGGFATSEQEVYEGVDYMAPFNYYYKYSCTQQIFSAEELAQAKNKKILSFKLRYQPLDYAMYEYIHDVEIYFKEVDYFGFTKNSEGKFEWEEVSDSDLVYTGSREIDFQTPSANGEDIEMEFVLDKPFHYKGGNLLIMAVKHSDDFIENDMFGFYGYPTGSVAHLPYTTLHYCNDSDNMDSAYPRITDGGGRKMRAVMMLTCIDSNIPDPDDDYPLPLFKGLDDEYTAGSAPVPLKLMGKEREKLTVFTVNGVKATEFNPQTPGTYKIEAASSDGWHRVSKYVKVK